MTDVIKLYRNEVNSSGYLVRDFLLWEDYRLATDSGYFRYLFPNLTKKEKKIFKTDGQVQRNLLRVVSRFLLYCGFEFSGKPEYIRQVKNLKRKENGVYVGLYARDTYEKLTLIMKFLYVLGFGLLAILLILAVCYAMKKDDVLKAKIESTDHLEEWKDMAKRKIGESDNSSSEDSLSREEGEEIEEDVCPFRGLEYTGNSCYQDSTLLALFAKPNKFIEKNILRKDLEEVKLRCGVGDAKAIQQELSSITQRMRGKLPSQCTNLRKLIKKCPGAQAFHGTGTQDAGEFLAYLFDLFNVEGTVRKRATKVTNDLSQPPRMLTKTHETKENNSPVVLISNHTLQNIEEVNLKFFLSQIDDTTFDEENLYKSGGKTYRRRIETSEIVSSKFLIFYAVRTSLGERRNYSVLVPPEKIELPEGDKLRLYAIVVHKQSHYTCYIRCGKVWYYYNDLREMLKKVGTYQEMLASEPSPAKEGTLYFYS